MVVVTVVLVGIAAAAIVCLVLAPMAGRPAAVAVEGERLVVTLRGPFAVLALRSRLSVPLAHVRSVEVVENSRRLKRGMRVGTYLPGGTIAGNFGLRPNKAFWAVQHRAAVLIEMDQETYARLVIEVDDPHGLVALLERVRS